MGALINLDLTVIKISKREVSGPVGGISRPSGPLFWEAQTCAVFAMQMFSLHLRKAQSSSYLSYSSLFIVLPDFHILLVNLQACPRALRRARLLLCLCAHHPAR